MQFLRFYLFFPAVLFLSTFAQASGTPPCTLDDGARAVTICSPTDGATLDPEFDVVAWAQSPNVVSLTQLYVDGAKVWEEHTNEMDFAATLTPGAHRITIQSFDVNGAFKKTVNVTVRSGGGTGCTISTVNPSITICSPTAGSTISSPAHIVAQATSSSAVQYMQIYVDGIKRYSLNASRLDTFLDLTPGSHRLTVQAKNLAGQIFKSTLNVTINDVPVGGCVVGTTDPSVTICEPADGALVQSPVHLVADTRSSSAVQYIQVYVDNVKEFSAPASRLDINLSLNPGPRRVTVQAKNNAGVLFKKTINITVATPGGGGCTPGAANPSVTICSPSNGATVASPVQVVAETTSDTAVNTIQVLVDGSQVYQEPDGNLDVPLPMSVGAHQVTVQASNAAGTTFESTVNITVSDGGGSGGGSSILTHHYDNQRTGQKLDETVLNPTNVNKTSFGKRFSYTVDGYVFAQPLYVPHLSIPGKGTFNVVFVATQRNIVYAFDADGAVTTPLWNKDLNNGFEPMSSADVGTSNSGPWVGITGTPVIDPTTNTLYAVTATDESGTFHHRLHALDIQTGDPKFGGSVDINACVAGTGYDNVGGQVCFNPKRQNQRPALLLHNGTVYVGWGSHHVLDSWHGWLMGFDAGTLQRVAVFNSTPNDRRGGIWQGGGGPAADPEGNVYVSTGQGTFSATRRSYGDTLVKLDATNLAVLDYFTPFNQAEMNTFDLDMGSGGVLVLPTQTGAAHPKLVLAVNKQGNIYLVDRENMGKFNAGDDHQIVQAIYNVVGNQRGTPAYWNGYVYFAGEQNVLKQFQFTNGLLSGTPVAQSTVVLDVRGAVPVVTANGTSNGIVWLVNRRASNSAVLYAHDARDVSKILYHTEEVPARDTLGRGTKFSVPTVSNGKVYVGTENMLVVYGLLP